MPTYERELSFVRDWLALSRDRRGLFMKAVAKMVIDLQAGTGFCKGLRVKGVQGYPDVYEMTWAPDGRATFHYGTSPHPGDTHIVWRRIGTHDILKNP
ncbi:MAG TPA: hypothetical protein VLJ14_16360 [Ktedonobacterales bacterium]|jgi:hypothetical protein|nr:hypothetical protein [Ktedonobacterales bacterium]